MSAAYKCPLGYSWREANAVATHVARRAGVLRKDEASDIIEGAKAPLPFYADHKLLRLRRREWPPFYACYYIVPREGPAMLEKGDWVRLNSSSPPLHDFNHREALALRQEHAVAYLRFFCFFVHGDGGCFALVERTDDPIVPAELPEDMAKVLEHAARPIILEGRDDDGRYLLSAIVWYGYGLFLAQFAVAPSGEVEMLDDDPIAAKLPLDPAWRVD